MIRAKRYLEMEEYLLEASDAFGVDPNIFDLVVWTAVKAFKCLSGEFLNCMNHL